MLFEKAVTAVSYCGCCNVRSGKCIVSGQRLRTFTLDYYQLHDSGMSVEVSHKLLLLNFTSFGNQTLLQDSHESCLRTYSLG